jgi:hypothetical protein
MSIVIFIFLFLSGCAAGNDSLSQKQKEAVANSISFIKNSSFTCRDQIDAGKVSIRNATERTWESAWHDGNPMEQNETDANDWIITVGDTSGFNFAMILCDSGTGEVIGYIPVD